MAALLALLAAAGWGSSDYAAGSASRRSSAVSVVILTHFAAAVALVLFALDFGPLRETLGDVWAALRPGTPLTPVDTTEPIVWSGPAIGARPTAADLLWGLAAGLGGGLGAMLLFRGLGKGSMAVVAPITATGAAAIPALFGIASGEAVTLPGVLGIALTLVAIVLVSLTGDADDAHVELPLPSPTAAVGAVAVLPPPLPTGVGLAPPATSVAVLPPPTMLPPPGGPRSVPPASLAPPAPTPPSPGGPDDESHVAQRRDADGEIRMSLRRMRATIVSLTVAALLAAAVAAAGPVGAVIAGGGLGSADIAALALAVVVVGLTLSAANAAKLLFRVQAARPAHLERRADPPSFDARDERIERRVDASSFDVRSILRQPGLPEALLSGVGFGLFFVFISRAGESAGYWPLVGARTISVVMFAIAALVTTTAVLPARGWRGTVVLAGALDAAAAVCFVMSTRAGLLSVGAVLASLYPVVTVVLARFVGGERIRRRQFVGLALAIGAVSLLAI